MSLNSALHVFLNCLVCYYVLLSDSGACLERCGQKRITSRLKKNKADISDIKINTQTAFHKRPLSLVLEYTAYR